jgi:hypothetical protein
VVATTSTAQLAGPCFGFLIKRGEYAVQAVTDYTNLLEPINKLFPSTEAIQASPNTESDASRFVRVGSLFYLGIRRRNPDFPCPEPDAKPVKRTASHDWNTSS